MLNVSVSCSLCLEDAELLRQIWVLLYCHFIVDLDAPVCYIVYVELLECIHHSSFPCVLDYVHDVSHRPESMALI